MIEIEKYNESYRISDSAENGWSMTGTANNNVDGSCDINFSVSKPGELVEDIGSCNYYKPIDGKVSVSYSVTEANRDEFVTYVDSIIDSILTKFSE